VLNSAGLSGRFNPYIELNMKSIAARLQIDAMTKLRLWGGFSKIWNAMEKFPAMDAYLAGGVLRNIISGVESESKDFDFFVGGEQVDEFLCELSIVGKLTYGPFGSPRWRENETDKFYCDIIRIEQFNNGLWQCQDIIDVLNQFDFTANAVALDLRSGEIFNPQNGLRDAKNHIMRAVRFDYPDEAISESINLSRNCILWMRLNHYAKVLKYQTDSTTRHWILKNAHYISDANFFGSIFFIPEIDISAHCPRIRFDSKASFLPG
jgi:hypothetical protein